MARNINLSIVENIFNDLGEINLEPKIYEQIEKELQFEGRDKRFHLHVSCVPRYLTQKEIEMYKDIISKRG